VDDDAAAFQRDRAGAGGLPLRDDVRARADGDGGLDERRRLDGDGAADLVAGAAVEGDAGETRGEDGAARTSQDVAARIDVAACGNGDAAGGRVRCAGIDRRSRVDRDRAAGGDRDGAAVRAAGAG